MAIAIFADGKACLVTSLRGWLTLLADHCNQYADSGDDQGDEGDGGDNEDEDDDNKIRMRSLLSLCLEI